MVQTIPSLFDFSPFAGQSAHYVALIKQFAAAHVFRSATVDELVQNDDYHRRPLRPEDFEFLKFMKPVRSENVSRLQSLASHRTLLSIYELDIARMPRSDSAADWQHFMSFYRDDVRTLGAQIAPFLEAYAFEYLGNAAEVGETAEAAGKRLERLVDDEHDFWDKAFARLMRNDYLEDGLRFIMIQRWALAPSKRRALVRAIASGCFDMLPEGERPTLSGGLPDDRLVQRVAQTCGVTGAQHTYWQFYLPTSIAKCTLLYALARRPEHAFALVGAAFAAEAEWLAFGLALQRACAHLQPEYRRADDASACKQPLVARFSQGLRTIERTYGAPALAQCVLGLAAGERLAERGRWDLGEQLSWLSAIEQYREFAHRISARIDAECPDIDRETFVEPYEMCSTTHVHNDHRLVTIQEGEMLFWGNLGMKLKMDQGDMVLIPDGRLHGSTVASRECIYHQPVIPDDWVRTLVAEMDAKQPA